MMGWTVVWPPAVATRARNRRSVGEMQKARRVPLAPPMNAPFLRADRRQIAMAVMFGACLAVLIFISGRHGIGGNADPICEALDPLASEVIARLAQQRDDVGLVRLNEAVATLRRARSNCRHGFVALARSEYNAMLNGEFGRRR
jgi:hypothetical protein